MSTSLQVERIWPMDCNWMYKKQKQFENLEQIVPHYTVHLQVNIA